MNVSSAKITPKVVLKGGYVPYLLISPLPSISRMPKIGELKIILISRRSFKGPLQWSRQTCRTLTGGFKDENESFNEVELKIITNQGNGDESVLF